MDFSVIRPKPPSKKPEPPAAPKAAPPAAENPPPPPPQYHGGGPPPQWPFPPYMEGIRSVEYSNLSHWKINFGEHPNQQQFGSFVYHNSPVIGGSRGAYNHNHPQLLPPPHDAPNLLGLPAPDAGYLYGPPPPDHPYAPPSNWPFRHPPLPPHYYG